MSEIQELKKEVAELKSMIKTLTDCVDTITIREIAMELGKSESYLRGDGRWLLPNNGVPDYEGKPNRWRKSTWIAWKKKHGN